MAYYPPNDLIGEILKILRRLKRPVSLEEIAFRTRGFENFVSDILEILIKYNTVLKNGDYYTLNREK